MIEHWVERYHQVGFRYDDKWRRMKGEDRKAEIRSHREHIAANFEVMRRLNALNAHFKKGKRKITQTREASRKNNRIDRRAQLREEWMAQDADVAEAVEEWLEPDDEETSAAEMLVKMQGSV